MKRTKAKKKVMGYALFIRLQEDESYQRQGFLFNNAREAGEYRDTHYPNAQAWSIQRVRLDPTQVFLRGNGSEGQAA